MITVAGKATTAVAFYVEAESSRQGVGTVQASSNFAASHYES